MQTRPGLRNSRQISVFSPAGPKPTAGRHSASSRRIAIVTWIGHGNGHIELVIAFELYQQAVFSLCHGQMEKK